MISESSKRSHGSSFFRAATTASALMFSGSVLALGVGGGGDTGADPTATYASSGSYATTSGSEGNACTVYRPRNVPEGAPLILWGNGTGTSPSSYAQGLRHWASHGFVVAAANTANAGSGSEMLACIDAVRSASYGGSVDFSKIGASGHSQGGGGAVFAGQDPRIIATAPMQPYPFGFRFGDQTGPMLLMSGGTDNIASRDRVQGPIFERVNVPVFWATQDRAGHFEPSYNFGAYRGISTAWWLYQLKGDTAAAALFDGPCTACDLAGWTIERKGF